MPPKRAAFLMWSEDEECKGIRKFLEDAGIVLDIRDLTKRPFTVEEVEKLVRHIPLEYFLNPHSGSFTRYHLDQEHLDRENTISLIAKDPTLLRQPIIRTNRLFTVGIDRKKICEMLQISPNGKKPVEEEKDELPPLPPLPQQQSTTPQ
jgi:arsenate reductase-like glutaredoxin family protein